jgi:uncharacterized damage-inducible protein DinB
MTRLSLFKEELLKEAIATRKILAAIPNDKYNWKPHPKSMSIEQLGNHIVELPLWMSMVLHTQELDFAANPYSPTSIKDTAVLLETFEKNLADGINQLSNAQEATLDEPWTLRNGKQVYSTEPKAAVIRMSLSQIIHHRAQMGVFLRLLDIPVPGTYGPSADENF